MKKKRFKGFTLIELLGVLIVLSIIALILVPTISKVLKDFKEDSYQNQIKEMCLSVENWKSDHISELPEDGETITISLGNLKNGGYIDYKIKNPLTDKYFPNDMLIEITKVEKNINCKVIENSGNNKEDYNIDAPILVLKGSAFISLDVAERYVEPGYYATTTTGLTIPKERISVEYYQNGNKVSGIDSSKNGTFEIKYSVTDKGVTVSLIRQVVVKDITPPVMVINGHSSLNEQEFTIRHNAEETFTMPTVTITDNSRETITPVIQGSVSNKVPGNYTLTYTATDSTGNSTVMKVHYVVYDETPPTVKILGNPTAWTNQSITLAVNATDNGSGLPSKAYSFDGGSTWQSGNTLLVENNRVLNIWVTDNAGNITKNTVTVSKIDKTIPDATFTVTSGTSGLNYWYTSNINVKITPTAGGSGVSSYKYCTTTENSCTPSTTVNGSSPTTLTLSTETTTNKICVVVTNTLNVSHETCSSNYKIDKTIPTLTVDGHTSDYSVSFGTRSSYTLPTGTSTDNLTTPTVTKTGSVTSNLVGTYKVTYTAKDDAGNSKSLILTVNVLTPTYSAWMTEVELNAAGHTISEEGVQSKTQYSYQDASSYSGTWTTTQPTFYRSKTQYKVNYEWYNPCSKEETYTCTQAHSPTSNPCGCGINYSDVNDCGLELTSSEIVSSCSGYDTGCPGTRVVCVPLATGKIGKKTYRRYANDWYYYTSCTKTRTVDCSTSGSGTTDWQDSSTCDGATGIADTRTVYSEVNGWGSASAWQDTSIAQTPTRKVSTRTVYRYQTN